MGPDRIRVLLKATPFQSFNVELPSGKRVFVKHSDYALLSPAGRTLIVHDDADNMEMIDVFLITDVSIEGADATHV